MKVTIIGAGNVGATCAMRILEAGLADIVLLDVMESIAKGKAEDLMDAASIVGHKRHIIGTSAYSATTLSDIIVITAGFARKPGMSREELLNKNASIVKEVTRNAVEYNKNPIIIVVTNPLDAMTYLAYKESGLDHKRVFGMAGVLDSARMNLMIARATKKKLDEINSLVLGTHGETMVAAISHSKAAKNRLSDLLKQQQIDDIVEKTKSRGAQIISYLGQGSAYYGPSAAVFKMVKAIAEDTKEVLPCSCFLQGEYGIDGIYLGVPARIGKNGIEKIIEAELAAEEKRLLKEAADSVRNQLLCMM
jgi:malate dehydrogenase